MKYLLIINLLACFTCFLLDLGAAGTDPLDELISGANERIFWLDKAKERSSGCRYLVKFVTDHNVASGENKHALEVMIPKMMKRCYLSLEHLIAKRFKQLQVVISKVDYRLLASSSPIAGIRLNEPQNAADIELKNKVLSIGMSAGWDFCPYFKTGFLCEAVKIGYLLFSDEKLEPYKTESNPLSNYGRYKSNKPDSNIGHLLKIAMACNSVDKTDLVDRADDMLKSIRQDTKCSLVNVLIIQKLHKFASKNTRRPSNRPKIELPVLIEPTQAIFEACLADLAHVRAKYNIMEYTLNEDTKLFATQLIDYLDDKFDAIGSSNLMDKMNARSLYRSSIEHDLFFERSFREKFKAIGYDPDVIYRSGGDICKKINTLELYSSNIVVKEFTDTMEKIHILMSIDNLQVSLANSRDNNELQMIVAWYVCQDLDLFTMDLSIFESSVDHHVFPKI